MNEILAEPTRSQRLKAATHATHEVLDKRVMAADIFASREQFARFLRVQYRFHRDIDALYAQPELVALIPELEPRRRLPAIAHDLGDLGEALPSSADGRLGKGTALAVALGWLYVAEGSNLGGTVLYRLAAKLGLDKTLGARHLAAHPEGAARHWRTFTAALDTVPLTPTQEDQVIRGAEDAFRAVLGYVHEELPLAGAAAPGFVP